jgi:hypothetical protein
MMTTSDSERVDAGLIAHKRFLPPYQVNYADGTTPDTFHGLYDAGVHIESQWPDAVYVVEDDRILVWATAADADGQTGDGDDGTDAVCEIRCSPTEVS